MRPEVIVHNTLSLDGAVRGFEVDMGLHYEVAGSFGAGVHLIGSGTALAGLEMFSGPVPPETDADRRKPAHGKGAVWALVDPGAKLQGKLHALRSSGFCWDLAVLVSAATEAAYLRHLQERDYDVFQAGDPQVDLARALAWLGETYSAERILVDAGPTLVCVLLAQGLVDRLSLLVSPLIAGHGAPALFERLPKNVSLSLVHAEPVVGDHLRVEYRLDR